LSESQRSEIESQLALLTDALEKAEVRLEEDQAPPEILPADEPAK
jgi:hypothetical protein